MGTRHFNRRNFLKTSLFGGTSALFTFPLATRIKYYQEKDKQVIKRKLGKTGIELPIVSFGVMRADNPALIQEAIKKGVEHFDTAHGYQRGKNEEMLGEIFNNVPRNSFILSTKVKPEETDRETGKIGPASTSKAFLEKLDISLSRLKVDYVDLLYVHSVSSRDAVLFPEMLEAVTEAKKSGKARHVGVSVHKNEPEVIEAAIESGIYEVVLTSVNFKQAHYASVTEAIAKAAKAGLGIIAMKTMAGGFHDKERTQPINCKAALKFVLQDKNITTAIPGITNFDQLEMNTSVNYDMVLTKEERDDLALMENIQGGLYCQGCEHCKEGCSKNLPIPDIMRAYMYNYGYRDSFKAHSLISELALPENPCGDCAQCTAICQRNFAVSERISDIVRLTKVPGDLFA